MTTRQAILINLGFTLFWFAAPNWSQNSKQDLLAKNMTDISGKTFQTLNKAINAGGDSPMSMNLKSSAFEHNGEIPERHTCEGKDISPALSWSDFPKNTKSFALIVDDPDAPDPAAPKMTWVHWILYNIPSDVKELPEAVAENDLPTGTRPGLNDWKKIGYGGPCPPIERHRYFFKLYALDTVLPDLNQPTKPELEKAMRGHIIGQSELIGTYQKHK